jgi:hypothetical protein
MADTDQIQQGNNAIEKSFRFCFSSLILTVSIWQKLEHLRMDKTGGSFFGVKTLEREDDHSFPSTTKVKNCRPIPRLSYTSS